MTPKTEGQLAEMIAAARGPLKITGGGTRPIGAPVTGEVIDTSGLSGITLYEPGALTIVAQAGTPVADIEAALDAENQRLAFEPMDHRGLLGTKGAPTIGGIVAGNVSGPRRISVGACRDHMLGVRFVDGTGTVMKNGGRVMKNVTGYDLVKLLTGSYGTLGVLTEVSLKVLPKPETSATMVLELSDVSAAVSAMSRALGSPYEITGAAHDCAAGKTYLRIEGFAKSVAYRSGELTKLLAEFGAPEVMEAKASQALWQGIRDVAPMHGKDGDIWRISVKPSDAPRVIDALGCKDALLDWGGGLIWAHVPAGMDVRAALAGTTGHATLLKGATAQVPVFHPEAAPLAKISADLRAKFDPRGILNTGLMA